MTVPQGTVAEILDWVADDPVRAQEALDAEYSGAGRSTLITQLEAIATKEANPVTDPIAPEDTGLAPAAVPPDEVLIYPDDLGVTVGPVHLADDAVEQVTPTIQVTGDGEPIDGEQVEYLQAAAATNGMALALNGVNYLLNPHLVAVLKGVVERAVAAGSY